MPVVVIATGVVASGIGGAILGILFERKLRRRLPRTWKKQISRASADSINGLAIETNISNPQLEVMQRLSGMLTPLRSINETSRSLGMDTPPGESTGLRFQISGGAPLYESCSHGTLEPGMVLGLGGFSQYNRILLCMVGLPARGKSYITKMLQRYLTWAGFPVECFNAGNLRRQEGMAGADASFFSSKEKEAMRERIASLCMEEAIQWLKDQKRVCVAIFDATNTTQKRRQAIMRKTAESKGIIPVFVESICDDPEILERNYSLKLGNDDYHGMDPEKARADFLQRVKAYEQRYETIVDSECDGKICYIKLYNVGQKVVMYHCYGFLQSQISSYLSNVHISPRSIWLTRHAQSEDQVKGVLGSVSDDLTPQGKKYCRNLANFLRQCREQMREAGEHEGAEILVLIGTAPVHRATLKAMTGVDDASPTLSEAGSGGASSGNVAPSPREVEGQTEFPAMSTSLLNELDGGVCNGMSYEMIRRDFPDIWAAREQDKLNFRYPGSGGESYADVVGRLRPIIIELERQRRSLLVISHLAVQRCLYAYFRGCPMEEMPHLPMDMHTVAELRPGPFGSAARTICLDDEGPPKSIA